MIITSTPGKMVDWIKTKNKILLPKFPCEGKYSLDVHPRGQSLPLR
jgi:hypothetical protein